MNTNRPYLIIPKLIIQPTWGGTYIPEMKGWQNLPILQGKKIGQSYELFSGTKLALSITDTSDPRFVPEIGFPDSPDTITDDFKLTEGVDYVNIDSSDSLLIKINHSKGNSFQLHVKPNVVDSKWTHKAESWYYLEDGKLTFGIKKGIDINEYKNTCIEIYTFMQEISRKVVSGQLDIATARQNAKDFVLDKNPWQFVNVYEANKYDVVDPSLGGIHHSWEEDDTKFPLGNVVYEIQEDAMDPISVLRSFDQGKIKDDGSVREINIEDYFKYLDTSDVNNDIERSRTLSNSIYAMDAINVDLNLNVNTDGHFHHLFVRDGSVEVVSGEFKLKVGRGHSAFIPKDIKSYIVNPTLDDAVILKTYSTK